MKQLYIHFIFLFFISSSNLFGQTTLLSEDFETNNISTTFGIYPYQSTDACSGIFGWRKKTIWSAACGACINEAATIQITSSCTGFKWAYLNVGTFVPTTTSARIQFDYGYERDAGITSTFIVRLNDLTAVTTVDLVNINATADASYDMVHTVIPGNTYEIELEFFAFDYYSFGHGATFDNLLVTDPCSQPVATFSVLEDCGNSQYQIQVDVTGLGSATGVDIAGNASIEYTNVGTGTYILPSGVTYYSSGTGTDVTVDGALYGGCLSSNSGTFAGCQADTCEDALDILGLTQSGVLEAANIDAPLPLLPNFISCGNGNTLASCDWGFTNGGYNYTDWTDLWFQADIPDGSDEITLNFTNLTGPIAIIPYAGSCGSLTQLPIDMSPSSTTDGNCPYLSADGPITFNDLSAYSTAPIYFRIVPQDDGAFGAAGCPGNNFTYGSFDIIASSPQPNDICANSLDITTNFGGSLSSGSLNEGNDEGNLLPVSGFCGAQPLTTTGQDLWYEINMPAGEPVKDILFTLTFLNPGENVYAYLYDAGCFDLDVPEDCAYLSSSSPNESITHLFEPVELLLTAKTYYIRLLQPASNGLTVFDAEAIVLHRNNQCDIFNNFIITHRIYDGVAPQIQNASFNFSTSSLVDLPGGIPTTPSNLDLWFDWDPELTTDGNGLNTWSGHVDFDITGLNPGEEMVLVLYDRFGYSGNCLDYNTDFIDSVTISSDGTYRIGCLDIDHGSSGVGDGYITRLIVTNGSGVTSPTISATPAAEGPPANDMCSAIFDGTNPTFEGSYYDITNDTIPADFSWSRNCTGIADSCNGLSLTHERDLWFQFSIPSSSCPDLGTSTSITTVDIWYDADNSFRDAYVYVYGGCDYDSLMGCGNMDGAGENLYVDMLEPGRTYLVRVMPSILNSDEEYPFDIGMQLGPVRPCNDIAGEFASAPTIQDGFDRTLCPVMVLSAQGATETANIADGWHDVWFEFTAPFNGGPWVLPEAYVSVYLEAVSGHTMKVEIYQLVSGNVATGALGSSTTNTQDEARLHLGHLNQGGTYYIRVAHNEPNLSINNTLVEYKLCLYQAEGINTCPHTGANIVSAGVECDNDCSRFYKIDLPENTPSGFYRIEVIGDAQDVDMRLRYQGMDSPSGEGNLTDYDHPCNAAANVAVVSTGLLPDPGTCNGGTGEWKVYNLIGPVTGQRNFYYLEVYDPISVLGCGGLPICEVKIEGPYTSQALADAGGPPDGDCGILPLDWISLNGHSSEGRNTLNWEISFDSEIRSFDISFQNDEQEFESLETVEAQSGLSHYYWDHLHNSVNQSTWLYKITARDINGSEVSSRVIELTTRKTKIADLKVYPNPGTGVFELGVDLVENENVIINLTDLNGNQIMEKNMEGKMGYNQFLLNIEERPSGVYFLSVYCSDRPYFRKIIKY